MYKPYKPRSRRWKQKPRRRPWYFYVAALAGILVGLELIARLVISSTGLSQTVLPQASELDRRVAAYQLEFLSPSGQPYPLPDPGQLQAVRSPLLGYQLLPQQQSDYWQINAQGFRADQAVALQKAANELRILLMGGSMAFGQLSSNNQATLASQIETRLNAQVTAQQAQPGQFQPVTLPYTADEVQKVLQRQARIPERQYRVVNAAVPGYASGNSLARLVQLSAYSPDLLLLLDGQTDLLLPSTYSAADVPGLDALLLNQAKPAPKLGEQLGNRVTGWLNQLYAVRALQYLRRQPQEAAVQPAVELATADLNADSAELEARVQRYQAHLAQMLRWSTATRKQILIGLEPTLLDRNQAQLSQQEQAILAKLGSNYQQQIKAGYSKLTAAAQQAVQSSANAKLLDLKDLYAQSSKPAFQSATSLTDEAYAQLAERFYQTIVAQLAVEPKSFGQ